MKMSVGTVGRIASGRREANGRENYNNNKSQLHPPLKGPGRLIFAKELKQIYWLVDRF